MDRRNALATERLGIVVRFDTRDDLAHARHDACEVGWYLRRTQADVRG